MGESYSPAGVISDEVGNLETSLFGCGCGSLDNQEAIVRVDADAEGEEGNRDGSGFGGAAECLDHKSLFLGASCVEPAHPGEGV